MTLSNHQRIQYHVCSNLCHCKKNTALSTALLKCLLKKDIYIYILVCIGFLWVLQFNCLGKITNLSDDNFCTALRNILTLYMQRVNNILKKNITPLGPVSSRKKQKAALINVEEFDVL